MAFIHKGDVIHLGFVAGMIGLRLVPRSLRVRWMNGLARRLGGLWYRLAGSDAELTRANLKAVLGDRDVDAIARGVFQNVALHKLVHDIVPSLGPREIERMLSIEGEDHLKAARAQGKGVILLSAHFGIPGYLQLSRLDQRGYPTTGILGGDTEPDRSWVYRKIIQPVRHRARRHYRLISPDGTPQRELVERLRHNEVLLILGEVLEDNQHLLPQPQVLPTPLLGHTLPLKTGPFRLARWIGSPVLPVFMEPREGGFQMTIEPPLALSADNSPKGLAEDLAAFAARFESYLARYPWLWMHWRHAQLIEMMQAAPQAAEQVSHLTHAPLAAR